LEPVILDPSFIARCGTDTFDEIIGQHDLWIVEGSGAADHSIEVVLQWHLYKAIQYVERRKSGLIVVVDEAANWRLINTVDVLRAVATLEKYGLELVILTQTLSVLPTDVRVSLLQNAHTVMCYRVGSIEDARLMAQIFGIPQFHAESSVIGQHSQIMQELMTLPVGERYVKRHGKVYREKSPHLKDPYPWPGLSDQITQEALEKIMEGPFYRTPTYTTPAEARDRRG
jgi:hypothetical protein